MFLLSFRTSCVNRPLSVTSSNSWERLRVMSANTFQAHRPTLPEDKGARLVRYSKETNRVGPVSPGEFRCIYVAGQARHVLPVVESQFGQLQSVSKRMVWAELVYHLRPLIQAIKLPEFYPANESSESIRAVWLTAINERERLKPLKRRPKGCARLTRYVQPALTRALRMLVSETGGHPWARVCHSCAHRTGDEKKWRVEAEF